MYFPTDSDQAQETIRGKHKKHRNGQKTPQPKGPFQYKKYAVGTEVARKPWKRAAIKTTRVAYLLPEANPTRSSDRVTSRVPPLLSASKVCTTEHLSAVFKYSTYIVLTAVNNKVLLHRSTTGFTHRRRSTQPSRFPPLHDRLLPGSVKLAAGPSGKL